MTISIRSNFVTPDCLAYEVVERKGLGHPDTLADGLAEYAEIMYAKYCLEKFNCIPHHNFDKVMILGGQCFQVYGGEKFKNPIKVMFMGRGTNKFGDQYIPLQDIQIKAAKEYLTRVLPYLDVEDENTITFESLTSSYSTKQNWFTPKDIHDLPEYSETGPTANDTATMISYWPLTICEELALYLEGYFYKNDEKGLPFPRFKDYGGDIKVMVVRDGENIIATLAVPQITSVTFSKEEYFKRENALLDSLKQYVKDKYPNQKIEIIVNANSKDKLKQPYLVTAGSCIDFGEEGAVGRGNKTHGIISSFRPNTMEAPHGKNSTYFVGKVLGYQSDIIAKKIYKEVNTPCQVIIRANIGDPLYKPSKIIVSTKEKVDEKIVTEIIEGCLQINTETTINIINEMPYIPRTLAYEESLISK